MAVDTQYQVVHEKTVGKSTYEACQRKERKEGYFAPDKVYTKAGDFYNTKTYVMNAMSKSCRNFYLWESKECAGCEYPKDTEYAERMKGME